MFKSITVHAVVVSLAILTVGPTHADFFDDFDGAGNITWMNGTDDAGGDYNADGIVDAADYTLWQDNLGLASSALNGNGSGHRL